MCICLNNAVAMIEGIYDVVFPDVPTSSRRWGRIVWLFNIEVGVKGKLLYIADGVCRTTSLSLVTKVFKYKNYVEIHTQSSIYKLKLLSVEEQNHFEHIEPFSEEPFIV